MAIEESRYPPDWIRIAEKDLERVQRLLRDRDAEAAGFYLQQAVEKFLKAYLLGKGWKLRRVHSLDALLDEAVVYDPAFEQFRVPCEMITKYYLAERYPLSTESPLTEEEIRKSLTAVGELIDKLRKATR